ncbi:MAG TPA: HD domain-containing protein [Candidatus Tectomicrobia bacterium]|nr:HD domain-containing protein [Candidatus Tectomicrobia bacterium]
MDTSTSALARAEAAEHALSQEMDRLVIVKSVIYTSGERDPRVPVPRPPDEGRRYLMGHDPRLPRMPERPTLLDYFRYRFAPASHLLQSARLAQRNGLGEKVVLACLLHDIAISGFIRADHGYWTAQMVEPYVDPEVAWAIRYHQALRFYPDESVGYGYPEMYVKLFGPDYRPEPYIERAYRHARNHRWYMTSRMITVNDLYAFDPNVHVELEEFTDIVGRNFRQPEEGLGLDDSPSAHMWRTIMWPTRYL